MLSLLNCFSKEYLYSCKAKDVDEQDLSCTCIELNEKENYNCTCFADVHYLDCYDALMKGNNKSGVYSLKPDNMVPFKVQHCL